MEEPVAKLYTVYFIYLDIILDKLIHVLVLWT